jgi:hypothetical protein
MPNKENSYTPFRINDWRLKAALLSATGAANLSLAQQIVIETNQARREFNSTPGERAFNESLTVESMLAEVAQECTDNGRFADDAVLGYGVFTRICYERVSSPFRLPCKIKSQTYIPYNTLYTCLYTVWFRRNIRYPVRPGYSL